MRIPFNRNSLVSCVILAAVVVGLAATIGRSFKPAHAELIVSDDAKALGRMIDAKSEAYRQADAEIVTLEARLSSLKDTRSKAEGTARAHRFALCNEYKLVYNGSGSFATATDCESFR